MSNRRSRPFRPDAAHAHAGALAQQEQLVGDRLWIDPIRVTFSPSERDLATIQRRRAVGEVQVEVRLSEDAGRRYAGTLTFLDNAVDPATGTIAARATRANSDLTLLPDKYCAPGCRSTSGRARCSRRRSRSTRTGSAGTSR